MNYKTLILSLCLIPLLLISTGSQTKGSKGIINSRHNLSASGPGKVKASVDEPVCNFCHTPHMAGQNAPMWNKTRMLIYTTYKSSTVKAAIGQPTGASRLCLSCHDGSIALNMGKNKKLSRAFTTGTQRMPLGKTNLGIDLSDDHPISFVYDNALASRNGQLKYPSVLTDTVKLDSSGQLQCTSCHNPHNDQYGKFLVADNMYSNLCTTCHRINDWALTSHSSSNATWNNSNPDPWPHTEYKNVAANGCENCHNPHNAGGRERLLNNEIEEQNCLSCHNGNVASKDIKKEFSKPYRHPIEATTKEHKPDEDPLWSSRHVECQDCHNPHAANGAQAKAPLASGRLASLHGVSSSGSPLYPLTYGYELCYRCHSDNPGSKAPIVTRYIFEKNLRLKFSTSNDSYHPIEAIGKNRDVPSLIAPLNASSMIYCTDCHSSDSAGSALMSSSGPHGSIWEPILCRQLVTSDLTAESSSAYSLCYKCHNRNSILSNQSFSEHRNHIVNEKTPCTACHDPHGVKNKAHLINFDRLIVFENEESSIQYETHGRHSGSCSLKCHNKNHDRQTYPQSGRLKKNLRPMRTKRRYR